MDNTAARKLIAAPSVQQEQKLRPQSRLLLTEPSGLLFSTLTKGGFAHFPEKIRLDVAMAVARAVDVEMEPDKQMKMVKSYLGNFERIYQRGGEKAVLSWCKAVRESCCFFGSSNMNEILAEAVKWAGENGNGNGADEYKKNALICGAEILMEPKVAAVLERAQEEVGEEIVPTLFTSFMAIGARWGVARAAKVAESISNVDMCNPDFLFSTLEICGSSGTELDALTDSLEKNGGLLWAVPAVDKGILETLVMRPSRIMNAILRREGFLSDSLLHNAMEQRERLGFLSIIADRRALEHPDKVVVEAAAKRLAAIAADGEHSIRTRISAANALAKVEYHIPDVKLKLKAVLEDEAAPVAVREEIALNLIVSRGNIISDIKPVGSGELYPGESTDTGHPERRFSTKEKKKFLRKWRSPEYTIPLAIAVAQYDINWAIGRKIIQEFGSYPVGQIGAEFAEQMEWLRHPKVVEALQSFVFTWDDDENIYSYDAYYATTPLRLTDTLIHIYDTWVKWGYIGRKALIVDITTTLGLYANKPKLAEDIAEEIVETLRCRKRAGTLERLIERAREPEAAKSATRIRKITEVAGDSYTYLVWDFEFV